MKTYLDFCNLEKCRYSLLFYRQHQKVTGFKEDQNLRPGKAYNTIVKKNQFRTSCKVNMIS